MLVDSSVWIDFLRGTDSAETEFLKRCLADGKAIWLAPPVLQEVLQGADSPERLAKWSRVLGELPMIDVRNMRALSIEAAKLYANCRWKAFTPRFDRGLCDSRSDAAAACGSGFCGYRKD